MHYENVRKFCRLRPVISTLSRVLKLVRAPFRRFRHVLDKRAISKVESLQDRFTSIYRRNSWGSKVSFSRDGSTLTYTESIINLLLELAKKYQISSVFDAPFGIDHFYAK